MPTILGEDKQIFFTNQNYVKKNRRKMVTILEEVKRFFQLNKITFKKTGKK